MSLRIILATWREHRSPSTLADFAATMDQALERFPDDPIHQEARTRAVLAIRDVLGQRAYDAWPCALELGTVLGPFKRVALLRFASALRVIAPVRGALWEASGRGTSFCPLGNVRRPAGRRTGNE